MFLETWFPQRHNTEPVYTCCLPTEMFISLRLDGGHLILGGGGRGMTFLKISKFSLIIWQKEINSEWKEKRNLCTNISVCISGKKWAITKKCLIFSWKIETLMNSKTIRFRVSLDYELYFTSLWFFLPVSPKMLTDYCPIFRNVHELAVFHNPVDVGFLWIMFLWKWRLLPIKLCEEHTTLHYYMGNILLIFLNVYIGNCATHVIHVWCFRYRTCVLHMYLLYMYYI